MTHAQHTPGPWDLTFGEYDAAIHTGGTIAMVDDTMRAWKANARLIAAAPELLDALADAFAFLRGELDIPEAELQGRLGAAIAKAKGA